MVSLEFLHERGGEKVMQKECCFGNSTYVIRATASEKKKRAMAETTKARAAPRRPQQATNAVKRAKTSKKSVISRNTHPKRHM
jgi:hypothetical protein